MKPFTSVIHQYVNNVFAITVKITFVMPYHGLIVYFKLKRVPRLEIFTFVLNAILTWLGLNVINLNKFTRSLENIRSIELKQCFQNKNKSKI